VSGPPVRSFGPEALAGLAGGGVGAFLERLGGPAALHQPGGPGPRRAVATLLHGNEPSGVRAVHRWLASGRAPAGDTLFLIGNVRAAVEAPGFAFRHLPDERDLNRCFGGGAEGGGDAQGAVAAGLLAALDRFAPACLLDVHNTTGAGPPFGVAVAHGPAHEALVGRFAPRLVVTELRLGALMEAGEARCPTVTIECGGAGDELADSVAWHGLEATLTAEDPRDGPADLPVELLRGSVRVELVPGGTITYGDGPGPTDVTVRADVTRLNFGVIACDEPLGWLGPRGLEALRVRTADGREVRDRVLRAEGRRLFPAVPLRLFMATADPIAAAGDCLFYAVSGDDRPF
jgi:hypothetical protein